VNSLLICILNAISVYKNLGYKFNLKKNFIIPTIASIIMGVSTRIIYMIIYNICKNNLLSLLCSILVAVFIYFVLIIKLGGAGEEEIKRIPKGDKLIKLAKRIKLL
jgi:stage V sporulation protein B